MTRNRLDFIKIKHGRSETLGANQYWYNQKFAALSGCGPTTASEVLAYLQQRYPSALAGLYTDDIGHLERKAFVGFMEQVRAYVKPGMMGLTDIDFYTDQTLAFAKSRGVLLNAKQITKDISEQVAFEAVAQTIDAGLPLAMLILTNPNPDIREYTWHWMTIIGYDKTAGDIIIATHGREHALRFHNVWVNDGRNKTEIVHFWPKDV